MAALRGRAEWGIVNVKDAKEQWQRAVSVISVIMKGTKQWRE